MLIKLIGSFFIIAGCTSAGLTLIYAYKRETQILQKILELILYISADLQYRLTPLPQLLTEAVKKDNSVFSHVIRIFVSELQAQISPNTGFCMESTLEKATEIPPISRKILLQLANCLGRFDLQGQIKSLSAVEASCKKELEALQEHQAERLRSYQTVAVCIGAVLAILLL